jgi:lipopolysaccharide transport system ATP-binding protein
MPDATSAIRLKGVSKVYRLFGSPRHQLMDMLGLGRLGLVKPRHYKEFSALSNVSLDVPKGARVGVIGRNGAGKTTLLKLVCGNFSPSRGLVEVNGTVQALMGMGIGFHPEYTGRENAMASLQYNGLSRAEYDAALADILDFCELGDFMDQPFRSYSLGMQARLMFATSTAVKPDILIVDEVLGAGDAYFIAKSRRRMENLVKGGCTMLLVSHSTQQVLEMCERAVWLDQGMIRMEGDAFEVVKAYEEYVHGSAKGYEAFGIRHVRIEAAEGDLLEQVANSADRLLQEPQFLPHAQAPVFPDQEAGVFHHLARAGLSRWASEVGLKVRGLDIQRISGSTSVLAPMEPARITFDLEAEEGGAYACRYGIAIHDHLGRCISRIFGPKDEFTVRRGDHRRVSIVLNPLQIGPGEYTLGLSVLEYGPLERIDYARRFDLLGRSFEFRVELPDSLASTECLVYHTAEWSWSS